MPPIDDHGGDHGSHTSDPIRQAELFRALADPTRLAIIRLVAHEELRVVDLTHRLGLAQSTVSAHLAVLRELGLVATRTVARSSFHTIADPEIDRLLVEADHVLARTAPGVTAPGGTAGSDAAGGVS